MKKVSKPFAASIVAFSLIFAFAASVPGTAQSGDAGKPRVAVFGFLNLTEDESFDIPAESAGSTLLLSIRMLGQYEASMPDTMPRSLGNDGLGRWCTANRMDYALYGTLTADGEGQRYAIAVFDNAKKTVTIRKAEKGSSALDVFGISDRLILAAVNSLSGRHVGFGFLKFSSDGEKADYSVEVDGVSLGTNLKTVDHVLSGTHRVRVIRASGDSAEEIASQTLTVIEGKTETMHFAIAGATAQAAATTKYDALVPHISSLNGKYTQQTGANEGFVHKISPFAIGKYEVTYQRWYAVYKWATSPERGAGAYTFKYPGRGGIDNVPGTEPTRETANLPVTSISWRDCILWCNARSEMEGLEPVYCTDSKFRVPLRTLGRNLWSAIDASAGGIDNPYINKQANGYRLPTSGEWQLAATCGGIYPYDHASGADAPYHETSGGKDIDSDGVVRYTDDVAVHSTDPKSAITDVGTRAPNKWGIYDMSGNAKEWVFDWDEGIMLKSPKTDYAGVPTPGNSRTIRGGGDSSYRGNDLRLGYIEAYICTLEDSLIGFRVCRSE